MQGAGYAPDYEVAEGLRTTGYFLETHLARSLGNRPLPEARGRFIDAFSRRV